MPKCRLTCGRGDGALPGSVIWCEDSLYKRYIARGTGTPVEDDERLTFPPIHAGKLMPDDHETYETPLPIECMVVKREYEKAILQSEREARPDVTQLHDPTEDGADTPGPKPSRGKQPNRNRAKQRSK